MKVSDETRTTPKFFDRKDISEKSTAKLINLWDEWRTARTIKEKTHLMTEINIVRKAKT